jgi:hypothetical protein
MYEYRLFNTKIPDPNGRKGQNMRSRDIFVIIVFFKMLIMKLGSGLILERNACLAPAESARKGPPGSAAGLGIRAK